MSISTSSNRVYLLDHEPSLYHIVKSCIKSSSAHDPLYIRACRKPISFDAIHNSHVLLSLG